MIKYLVMGIKSFIERKTCPHCDNGVLLPYAWKVCAEHEARNYRKTDRRVGVNTRIEDTPMNDTYQGFKNPLTLKQFTNAKTLIYDGDTIIGYKN